MSSRMGRAVASPTWGGREARRAPRSELLGSALMVVVWVLLWSFFTVAVLEPAAQLNGGRPPRVVERG